jgi:hypothetical protein
MPIHETRSDVTRFAHVDATGDARSLIAFLDTANALAGLRAAKQVLPRASAPSGYRTGRCLAYGASHVGPCACRGNLLAQTWSWAGP